jgi:hypothetical protein
MHVCTKYIYVCLYSIYIFCTANGTRQQIDNGKPKFVISCRFGKRAHLCCGRILAFNHTCFSPGRHMHILRVKENKQAKVKLNIMQPQNGNTQPITISKTGSST